jgi:hypothetical protein
MVEFVSWAGVAIIALLALVGFLGVMVTTLISAVRVLRHHPQPAQRAENRKRVASAA